MSRARSFLVLVALVPFALAMGDDKLKQIETALKAQDNAKAAELVKSLEADGVTKKPVVEALVKYGAAIEDAIFYQACVDTLSKAKDEARKELAKELKDAKAPQMRVLCADALTEANDDDAVEVLGKQLQDEKDRSVEVACVRGLGGSKKKSAVEPLIKFLEKYEKQKSSNVEALEEGRRALNKLTGSKFDTAQDWRGWWDSNKDKFDPNAPPPSMEGKTVSRGSKLFGEEIRSSSIVIVLDVSTSMRVIDYPADKPSEPDGTRWTDPGLSKVEHPDSRMAHARKQLVDFVKGLPAGTMFDLIAFGDDVQVWQKDVKLVQANDANKQAAIDWISDIKMTYATRTDLAMEKAFEHKDIDTIYLITDGNPEKSPGHPIDQELVLQKVRDLNRTRKIAVHTMGFPLAPGEFLQKMARENGGTYKDIR